MRHAVGVFNGNFRAGDYRRYRQQIEADARNPKEALLRVEARLMQECIEIEGESFWNWYNSEAVPDNGLIQERIDMIRARIADLQSQPSPIDEAQEIERDIDVKLSQTVTESLPHLNASGNLQWQRIEFDMQAIKATVQANSAQLKAVIDERMEVIKARNEEARRRIKLGTG